jgi:hypothetical protein
MCRVRQRRVVLTNFFGPAGSVFDPVADGEGGEHDRQVGLDRLAFVVVDRADRRSCLDMRKLFSMRHNWWYASMMNSALTLARLVV